MEVGMGNSEVGMWKSESLGSQNSHRHTQKHTDIFFIKGRSVCVSPCVSVANHIRNVEVGMRKAEIGKDKR